MLETRLLHYFLAIAREESITRAAAALHITQPSLSKQMMELEARLGKRLLVRGKRKVTLTEDGIFLKRRAEEILSLLRSTEREMSEGSALLRGEIRLAGAASASVTTAIARMREKYPQVSFQLQSGDAEKIEDGLLHGSLDFGVLLAPIDPIKYEHLPLKEEAAWGFLMARDHPLAQKESVTPEDLHTLPLILPQRIGLQQKLAAWSGLKPEEMTVAATFDILLNTPVLLIKKGLGCAFALSTLLDTGEYSPLTFRPLIPPLTARYALAWKHGAALSRAAEKFIEEVKRAT